MKDVSRPRREEASGWTYAALDLTFHTTFARTNWTKWAYLQPTGSDHEAICFTAYSTDPRHQETPQLGFNCKKADWPAFGKHVQTYVKPIEQQLQNLQQPTAQALDAIAKGLTEAITRAADDSIPRLRTVERSKPWWSKELTTLRQALHRAYRDYKSHQSTLRALEDPEVVEEHL